MDVRSDKEGYDPKRAHWRDNKSGARKLQKKRLKWYGHVRRMKAEHKMKRMLDVDIPGESRRGRPNLRWKDAFNRDMTQTGLKEDNATNRAEWRQQLISYTCDPKMT